MIPSFGQKVQKYFVRSTQKCSQVSKICLTCANIFSESDMCKPKVYEIEFKLIKSHHSLQFYGFDVQLN